MPHARDPRKAFQRHVDQRGPDECWPWTGSTRKSQSGVPYPRFWVNGRSVGGHRFALEMKLGRPLVKGALACHTCDVPLCVNGHHLYEGSAATNAQDREARGRRRVPRGEAHAMAQLADDAIEAIRVACAAGETQASVGCRYGVNARVIGKVARGERWQHLGGPTTPGRRPGRPRGLSSEQVAEARRLIGEGHPQRTVGKRLGVTQATISRALAREPG